MNSLSNTNTWADRVIERWIAAEVKLEPGTTLIELAKAESFLNFGFPDSFKGLYQKCNGFRGLGWDEHMFCFWSLDRIIEEYDPENLPDFIGFCDFLINSHFIGFHKGQSGIFKRYNIIGELKTEKISGDFQEAVDLINSSADNIY